MSFKLTDSGSVAAPVIHRLVERFLEGRTLPPIVTTETGERLSLGDWLSTLRHDQTPFNFNLAARFNLLAHPALCCEAALSLRDRLIESAPNSN